MTISELDAPAAARGAGDGNESDGGKRRQILSGARDVFLAKGYDGASMDGIAKAAGVSKGTLYVYFENKETLFEALILGEREGLAEKIVSVDLDGEDLQSALTRIATNLLAVMVRPDQVSSVRMVIGAAEKFPEFGRIFHRAGPETGRARMAVMFERLMTAGRLRRAEPDVVAGHFMDLCSSGLLRRVLFGVERDPPRERIEEVVGAAVEVFLRAYGTDRR